MKEHIRFVERQSLLNSKGFTLLSMMMSLFILGVVITLILNAYSGFNRVLNEDPFFKEAVIFSEQFQSELYGATSIVIVPSGLQFKRNGDSISYKLYTNYVRRQLNSTGNDVVLQNVKSITFEALPKGIHMVVTSQKQEIFEHWFLIYTSEAII